jgi:hypothetical protein
MSLRAAREARTRALSLRARPPEAPGIFSLSKSQIAELVGDLEAHVAEVE